MTSIGNLPTYNGYYQLSSQSGQSGQSGNTGQSNGAGSLLPALTNPQGQNAAAGNSAYLLDLSPEAQRYLAGLNGASPAASAGNGTFLLSKEDQAAITAILEKYKDAPVTQETFDHIQSDLYAAGLSPEQLAGKENAKRYNPTLVLLDALGGKDNPVGGEIDGTMSEDEKKTKTDNFMTQIVSQWKDLVRANDDNAQPDGDENADAVAAAGSTGGA